MARERARQARGNVAFVLDLCDRYDLPVTWATIGHLFLEHCQRVNGMPHPELPRVPYFENELWQYRAGDWFDADPTSQSRRDTEWSNWYAPDLIQAILDRRAKHEIGCHSFSHVIFDERHCPATVAAAELRCCRELADGWGLALRSFVFPGNVPGNYACLKDAGFTAYRFETWWDLDVPRRDSLGLWRIPGGIALDRPYAEWGAVWNVDHHVAFLRRCLDSAIEHGLVCSLWFHPEMDAGDLRAILPPLFDDIAARRSGLWITTMSDMADWLDTNSREPEMKHAVPA